MGILVTELIAGQCTWIELIASELDQGCWWKMTDTRLVYSYAPARSLPAWTRTNPDTVTFASFALS